MGPKSSPLPKAGNTPHRSVVARHESLPRPPGLLTRRQHGSGRLPRLSAIMSSVS